MKNISLKLKTLALALSCCAFGGAAFAASVYIDPASWTVSASTTFSLNIAASDMNDLYGYQFDLAYDPSKIRVLSIVEAAFLPDAGTTSFSAGMIDNGAGTVTGAFDSLIGATGATGTGLLATITFEALGVGVSAVTLSNVLLLDSNMTEIDASISSGSVTVNSASSVPIPPTAALIALGALGMNVGRRRQETSAKTET